MTDKATEFHRINEPRIERAIEQMRFIERSAKSMRCSDLLAPIVQPIREYLEELDPPQGPDAATQELIFRESRPSTYQAEGSRVAQGGASFLAEVAWAHDLLPDNPKLAKDRLRRILEADRDG